MRPADSGVVARAERLENAAAGEFSRIRPAADHHDGAEYRSDAWAVTIRDTDASAWLAARLPAWLGELEDGPQWPAEFSELQVRCEPGVLRVGVRYDGPRGGGRVLCVALRPRIDDSGAAWLEADAVQLGRLPLPAAWVIGAARADPGEVLPDAIAGFAAVGIVLDVARGVVPASPEPVVDLPDRRRVRLLGMTVRAGELELVCRTEGRSDEE